MLKKIKDNLYEISIVVAIILLVVAFVVHHYSSKPTPDEKAAKAVESLLQITDSTFLAETTIEKDGIECSISIDQDGTIKNEGAASLEGNESSYSINAWRSGTPEDSNSPQHSSLFLFQQGAGLKINKTWSSWRRENHEESTVSNPVARGWDQCMVC